MYFKELFVLQGLHVSILQLFIIYIWIACRTSFHDTIIFALFLVGAPCLSFDILPDTLGDKREEFPHTVYVACGTQAERAHANNVIVMKMSNLQKNKGTNEDDDDSDEDSEDEDEKPELDTAMLKHNGGVNRLRVCMLSSSVIRS